MSYGLKEEGPSPTINSGDLFIQLYILMRRLLYFTWREYLGGYFQCWEGTQNGEAMGRSWACRVGWRASTFLMYLRVAAVHTEVGIKSTGFRVTTNNSSCSLLKYHIFSIIEINLHAYSNGKWNQSQIYTCMCQSWTLFIYLLRKIQCIFYFFCKSLTEFFIKKKLKKSLLPCNLRSPKSVIRLPRL